MRCDDIIYEMLGKLLFQITLTNCSEQKLFFLRVSEIIKSLEGNISENVFRHLSKCLFINRISVLKTKIKYDGGMTYL